MANVPVLRSQLDAATAATTAEDLWDDPQVLHVQSAGKGLLYVPDRQCELHDT